MSSPPFSLKDSQYDLSTFTGRLRHFIDMTDPFTLLNTDKEVLESKAILDKYKTTGIICGSDYQMWKYRKVVEAAIHPITGDIIPSFFRVSAIAPVNIPIVFGMLLCPPTNVIGTLALHWINQSYNTACNYANRSGAAQSMEQIGKSYALAVTSACVLAYGLGKAATKYNSIKRFSFIIPFLATSAANVSNISLTRFDEIVNGVPVKDADDNTVGMSKIAGTSGVALSAVTRCILVPSSCLCLPPLCMALLRKLNVLPRSVNALRVIELFIIYMSLQVALPAALAIYPQVTKFNVMDLEEEFRSLKDKKTNAPVLYLYANKGL